MWKIYGALKIYRERVVVGIIIIKGNLSWLVGNAKEKRGVDFVWTCRWPGDCLVETVFTFPGDVGMVYSVHC